MKFKQFALSSTGLVDSKEITLKTNVWFTSVAVYRQARRQRAIDSVIFMIVFV